MTQQDIINAAIAYYGYIKQGMSAMDAFKKAFPNGIPSKQDEMKAAAKGQLGNSLATIGGMAAGAYGGSKLMGALAGGKDAAANSTGILGQIGDKISGVGDSLLNALGLGKEAAEVAQPIVGNLGDITMGSEALNSGMAASQLGGDVAQGGANIAQGAQGALSMANLLGTAGVALTPIVGEHILKPLLQKVGLLGDSTKDYRRFKPEEALSSPAFKQIFGDDWDNLSDAQKMQIASMGRALNLTTVAGEGTLPDKEGTGGLANADDLGSAVGMKALLKTGNVNRFGTASGFEYDKLSDKLSGSNGRNMDEKLRLLQQFADAVKSGDAAKAREVIASAATNRELSGLVIGDDMRALATIAPEIGNDPNFQPMTKEQYEQMLAAAMGKGEAPTIAPAAPLNMGGPAKSDPNAQVAQLLRDNQITLPNNQIQQAKTMATSKQSPLLAALTGPTTNQRTAPDGINQIATMPNGQDIQTLIGTMQPGQLQNLQSMMQGGLGAMANGQSFGGGQQLPSANGMAGAAPIQKPVMASPEQPQGQQFTPEMLAQLQQMFGQGIQKRTNVGGWGR